MEQPNYHLADKYVVELEEVPCNACGSRQTQLLCARERFGLPLRTVICRQCGLMFINPRPSKAMYAAFYQSDYRKMVTGSDEGDPQEFRKQVEFAEQVILPVLARFLPEWAPENIMDLGCSYGGILHALLSRFPGSQGFGLEPLVKIGAYARQRTGAVIDAGLLEDYIPRQRFDLVILVRSLNHTLDPRANLSKIRKMLSAGGVFVLVIQDAVSRSLYLPLEQVTEMDHPYLFTRETIKYMFDRVGLRMVGLQDEHLDARRMLPGDFRKIQFAYTVALARAGKPGGPRTPKPDSTDILERIRANQAAYLQYGRTIERWRRPNLLMRACRKVLNILGLW